MFRITYVAPLLCLLVGCGGLETRNFLPANCVPPADLVCHEDILNDGTGPDDHRQVCSNDTPDTWVFYPSGDFWHYNGSTVYCHVTKDGQVAWVQ